MQLSTSENSLLEILKDVVYAMEKGTEMPTEALAICLRKRTNGNLSPSEQELILMIERLILAQRNGGMNPSFYEAVELIAETSGRYP